MIATVHLSEYETLDPVHLSDDAARSIQSDRVLAVAPSQAVAGAWQVTAGSRVGVARYPGVDIWIHPKVPLENLFFLLSYASDPRGWTDDNADFEHIPNLLASVAAAFVVQAERALTRGLLQGYVTLEDSLPLVKGRILEREQVRRRFGLPLPVEVTFDDFTVDVIENRLLFSAARALGRMSFVPTVTRARLSRLQSQFSEVTPLTPGLAPPSIAINRRNAHYRPALELARLVLLARSLRFAEGLTAGVTFLFDMNRIFEDFVWAALATELRSRGVKPVRHHKEPMDQDGLVTLVPDITVWHAQGCRSVIDAKYKSIAVSHMPNADVYQMFAYCTALQVPAGHLIYAAGNEMPGRRTVRHAGTVIEVVALDLDKGPRAILKDMHALATAVLRPDTRPPRRDASPQARTTRRPRESVCSLS